MSEAKAESFRGIFSCFPEDLYDFVPNTVEEIFEDYLGRRSGLYKALTRDVELLYSQCNPENGRLCLYGYETGTWEVTYPLDYFPDSRQLVVFPQPVIGINIARSEMPRENWLMLIAGHCDSWLLSLCYFFGSHLSSVERNRLFGMINKEPTLVDVINNS